MGYDIRFNWILQLTPKQGFPKTIKQNKIHSFEKDGERIYPIETPLDLMDEERNIKAKIMITEITIIKNKTTGKFKIIEVMK